MSDDLAKALENIAENTIIMKEITVYSNYREKLKKQLIGDPHASNIIFPDQNRATAVANITDLLKGQPGIQVFGDKIFIRGFGSINGSNAPLIVLDGLIYIGDIYDIPSTDIFVIKVIKGAGGAIYGLRGGNGVIEITTNANAYSKFMRGN